MHKPIIKWVLTKYLRQLHYNLLPSYHFRALVYVSYQISKLGTILAPNFAFISISEKITIVGEIMAPCRPPMYMLKTPRQSQKLI